MRRKQIGRPGVALAAVAGVAAVLLLPASIARVGAATAYVQSARNDGTFGAGQISLTGVTAGSLLVLCATTSSTDGAITSISDDNAGTTWVEAARVDLSNRPVALWYAPNASAGNAALQLTVTGSLSVQHLTLAEYSGVATSAPLSDVSTGGPTTSTSASSGAADAAGSDSLLVGCLGLAFSGVTSTPGGSFTNRQNSTERAHLADRVAVSAGSYTYAATLDIAEEWGSILAVFAAPGGGGGGTARRLTTLGVGDGEGR